MNESDTRHEDNNLSSTGPTPEVDTTSTAAPSSATPEVTATSEVVTTETPSVVEAAPVEVVETAPVETEEVASDAAESVSEEGATFGSMIAAVKAKWNQRWTYTLLAIVVAALVLLALLFVMERQGRVEVGIFDSLHQLVDTKTAVAKVNDGKVSKYDLDVSVTQMSAGFAEQGADIESEEVKTEIQTRAVEMLINTELLKQEAAAQGIVITDEDVETRLDKLKTDVGGEEALKERMAEFNVSEKILQRDIRNELTIQALLDGVFKEKNVTVSEEEIVEFYDKAAAEQTGLPELEVVRPQIEQQLRTTKEQEVVTAYIEELRAKAEIEILI